MTKRLTKILGMALFLLFIGGSMIFPAWHMLHCCDDDGCCDDDCCCADTPAHHGHTPDQHPTPEHKTHDASNCPVCQLVLAPAMNAALVDVAPVFAPVLIENINPAPVEVFVSVAWRDVTQARAPPVA